MIQAAIPKSSLDAAIRARRRFDAFLAALVPPVTFADATISHMLDFLYGMFQGELKPTTILQYARSIDTNRLAVGLVPFYDLDRGLWLAFSKGVMRLRPSHSKYLGVVPFAPRMLLQYLHDVPRHGDAPLVALRDRTLFEVRCECVMRAAEAQSIKRSSIKRTMSPANEIVTTFQFTSKGSRSVNIATDSNYCACICNKIGGDAVCAACHLLRLKAMVEALPAAHTHDSVFTDDAGKALSRDRVRTIVSALMRKAKLPSVMTAHSLRHAVNQALQLAGVDASIIALRAGWSTAASNASQRIHYTHHRFVKPVFSEILFLSVGSVSLNNVVK